MSVAGALDLLLFLAGQGAAAYCLRTGRPWLGFVGTAALWVALDAWLVTHFVLVEHIAIAQGSLWAMRGVAAALASWLAFALWRRRWSAAARQRGARFAQGTAQFLRDDLSAAEGTFRRLVGVDPWDAMAWIWLGDVRRAAGDDRRARRCYRRAASVDRARACADLLALGRLSDVSAPAPRRG